MPKKEKKRLQVVISDEQDALLTKAAYKLSPRAAGLEVRGGPARHREDRPRARGGQARARRTFEKARGRGILRL